MDNASLWKQCQDLLWQSIGNEWIYKTWVAPVSLASYDAERGVVLRVPSRYVYEYIQHHLLQRYLRPALDRVFAPGVDFHYTVSEDVSFSQVAAYVQRMASQTSHARPTIAVNGAAGRLRDGLRYFLHDEPQWLPAYDKVAEWLGDNRGRGLFCVGPSGLGKTLICTKIIPILFGRNDIPVVSADEMNARVVREMNGGAADLLKQPVVIIDGLGQEPVTYRYMGNSYHPFAALCDAAEKSGHLLIITSSLSSSIRERYGAGVLDRLRTITRQVEFRGESLRGG